MRTISFFSMKDYKHEEDILFLVKKLNKDLVNDFDNRLNEFGLTSQQGRTLFFINSKVNLEKQEVNQVDLENRFGLSKSTVSGLVKRMEKNGLITVSRKKNRCYLVPTEKGMQIVSNLHENRYKTINKMFRGFNEEEQKRIITNINKLIMNIEEEEKDNVE